MDFQPNRGTREFGILHIQVDLTVLKRCRENHVLLSVVVLVSGPMEVSNQVINQQHGLLVNQQVYIFDEHPMGL